MWQSNFMHLNTMAGGSWWEWKVPDWRSSGLSCRPSAREPTLSLIGLHEASCSALHVTKRVIDLDLSEWETGCPLDTAVQ